MENYTKNNTRKNKNPFPADFVLKETIENQMFRLNTNLRLQKLEFNLNAVIKYLKEKDASFAEQGLTFGGRRKTRRSKRKLSK
jgi:hypothetical protein